MTHDEIKTATLRRPFRPFALRLDDGELVEVERADRIAVHPNTEKNVVVFDPDGTVLILDVALVTELRLA